MAHTDRVVCDKDRDCLEKLGLTKEEADEKLQVNRTHY